MAHKYKEEMHEMKHHGHKSGHGIYKNEVDKPEIPGVRANEPMKNASDFKGEAMDTAYGQAGHAGCKADEKKIHAQFKSYGWDSNTGY